MALDADALKNLHTPPPIDAGVYRTLTMERPFTQIHIKTLFPILETPFVNAVFQFLYLAI